MSIQKQYPCKNKCGTLIHFDDSHISQSGKKIPLEENGEPHQCPNSSYQKGQRTNSSITNLDEIDAKLDKILESLVEINNKLMNQETLH